MPNHGLSEPKHLGFERLTRPGQRARVAQPGDAHRRGAEKKIKKSQPKIDFESLSDFLRVLRRVHVHDRPKLVRAMVLNRFYVSEYAVDIAVVRAESN